MLRRMDGRWKVSAVRERQLWGAVRPLDASHTNRFSPSLETANSAHRGATLLLWGNPESRWKANLRDWYKKAQRTGLLRYEVASIFVLSFRDLGNRPNLLPRWKIGHLHFVPRPYSMAEPQRRVRTDAADLPRSEE